MKHRIYKTLIFVFSIFLFLLIPSKIWAESTQTKTVTYDINENGTANVLYEITLLNADPNSYISKYTLSTGTESVGNVWTALSSGQTLSHSIHQDNGVKSIEVTFPQPSRAQDPVNWLLSYSSTDPVETVGNVKEISVPGFVGDMNLTIIIKIPESFGPADYLSSNPESQTIENGKRIFKFTDPKIKTSGVFISAGESQFYQFTYRYELENNEDMRLRATVALPPDYKNQKIFFEKIEPTPSDGYRDRDGNYIAEYIVQPGEKYEILIEGKAKVINPISNNFESPNLDLERYLKPDVYWESNDSEIQRIASELKEGKSTNYEIAKEIYNYVSSQLSYNPDALDNSERERLGASVALKNKEDAICQEFSDLFVALCRAAGIPSRLLAGYTTAGIGYDLPQNTLHAWAEFYDDEKGWVTVDPTWESTSEGFDFFDNVGINHFVLSIRGDSSTEPPLVLSFTPTDDVSDNLTIEPISISPDNGEKEIEFRLSMPETVVTGIRNSGSATITNNTNQVISGFRLLVDSDLTTLFIPSFDEERAIFPGEQEVIEFTIFPKALFTTGSEIVEISLTGTLGEDEIIDISQSANFDIQVNNLIYYGLILIATIISILLIIGGRLIVKKFKAKKKIK